MSRRCSAVITISNNFSGCDEFYKNYAGTEPTEIIQHLESVLNLSDELTEMFRQRSRVYTIRASRGYISEILSASGARKLVVKRENAITGVFREHLALHWTECEFYSNLARLVSIRNADLLRSAAQQ